MPLDCSPTDNTRSRPVNASAKAKNLPLDGYGNCKVTKENLTTLFDTSPALHSYRGTRIVRVSHALVLEGGIGARPPEANILMIDQEQS
ncbi:uncharacterized protein N7529_000929 [Penicillium soppii]|jgi:hypothetical protein|uniref:uncharacterized protein n=1 Tax=Penicillium soppii TaxID=69789 RepID=UPI0025496407|nr:uncharacterized protein N7529_000929 [Penicillium soppii]KAJ5882257.1 hypothetical protein N7529_000929 [Penicillium soppii]